MKYFIIAGERSGDLHGSNLIKAIRQADPQAEIQAYGGDMMSAAGATIRRHYRQMNFMGLWEVLRHLGTVRRIMKECEQQILDFAPDAVVLIDYAGFNMRIAAFAKTHSIRTLYYISPKVWAWNTRRAWRIKEVVDRLYVIFPFEEKFFQKFDYSVHYVGNPLMDAIADFRPQPDFAAQHQLDARPVVALLPGSRPQEVQKNLAAMQALADFFPEYQFVVAKVSNLPETLYPSHLPSVIDQTYDLLHLATAAVVVSGTATLETALLKVPQLVVYRTTWLTAFVALKIVLKVPYVSLVNLVADRPIVPEFLQEQVRPDLLAAALRDILPGGKQRAQQLDDYVELAQLVGGPGASERAGQAMVDYLRESVQV
jgi:lipid-A-disaccharide synthase